MAELLYGRNAVREALRAGRRRMQRVLLSDSGRGDSRDELAELAARRGIPVAQLPRSELDRRIPGNHQGAALEAGPYPYADLDDVLDGLPADDVPLLLLLDHLQDPQNVGTLLRTAEVVGVTAVVLPGRRAAAITPAVVNASAGAVEHLAVAMVANLAQTIAGLQKRGIWVAGLEDDPRAQPYDRADLRGPLAVVVGAEGPGLARLTRERCDLLLSLPMHGQVASLNAAVAGSILLYHAWRARARPV